ncbi:MAG: hypothetical protein ACRDHP_08760, partial [Ktedonobacterales bacterium]
ISRPRTHLRTVRFIVRFIGGMGREAPTPHAVRRRWACRIYDFFDRLTSDDRSRGRYLRRRFGGCGNARAPPTADARRWRPFRTRRRIPACYDICYGLLFRL